MIFISSQQFAPSSIKVFRDSAIPGDICIRLTADLLIFIAQVDAQELVAGVTRELQAEIAAAQAKS
jgi:hypothetical protein